MKEQNQVIQYLLNTNNLYQIKVGEMAVEMEYSNNSRTFNDCMLNIFKRKIEK